MLRWELIYEAGFGWCSPEGIRLEVCQRRRAEDFANRQQAADKFDINERMSRQIDDHGSDGRC